MMNFAPRPRPARSENIVPMINVVFLLLIFFLMTASLEPAPPVKVTLPESMAEPGEVARNLYVDAEGLIAFDGATGDGARALLAGIEGEIVIHADRNLPASALARVLADLAALGLTRLDLATTGAGP
jgi:biopolymer transport protein ExbD